MTNDKDSAVLPDEAVPLIIQNPNTSRELFRINADGSVVGEIEDASEAAKVFFESLRGYLPQPTQSDEDEWEVLAVGYQALSGKAYHMSDCATCCAPAYKPLPCDCDAPTQTDALKIAREALEFYAAGIGHTEIEDGGKRAAEALAALEQSK